MKRLSQVAAVTAGIALMSGSSAQACGVCMGQTDGSLVGTASNGAIFLLLGFIGSMLGGIAAVAYSIWKRSKSPLPSHLEFAEMIGSQTPSK